MTLPFKITKREELVIFSIILSSLLLLLFLIPIGPVKMGALLVLGIVTYILSIIAISENIDGIEPFVLPILPVVFTVSLSLFYNILSERWLTRIGFIFLYGILIYSILLIENVFSVAKIKNIQLLKVARTIYFFVSSFTAFLFSYVILSFHLFGIISAAIFAIFIFLINLAFVWSFSLEKKFTRHDLGIAFLNAFIMFEILFVLTFWPLNIYLVSLFITSIYYTVIGIWDNILSFRVRGWSYLEYVLINAVVFALCLLTVNFG